MKPGEDAAVEPRELIPEKDMKTEQATDLIAEIPRYS